MSFLEKYTRDETKETDADVKRYIINVNAARLTANQNNLRNFVETLGILLELAQKEETKKPISYSDPASLERKKAIQQLKPIQSILGDMYDVYHAAAENMAGVPLSNPIDLDKKTDMLIDFFTSKDVESHKKEIVEAVDRNIPQLHLTLENNVQENAEKLARKIDKELEPVSQSLFDLWAHNKSHIKEFDALADAQLSEEQKSQRPIKLRHLLDLKKALSHQIGEDGIFDEYMPALEETAKKANASHAQISAYATLQLNKKFFSQINHLVDELINAQTNDLEVNEVAIRDDIKLLQYWMQDHKYNTQQIVNQVTTALELEGGGISKQLNQSLLEIQDFAERYAPQLQAYRDKKQSMGIQ